MVQIVIAALANGMDVGQLDVYVRGSPYASKREVRGKWASTCSALLVQRNVSAGKWLPCYQFRERATRTGRITEDSVQQCNREGRAVEVVLGASLGQVRNS